MNEAESAFEEIQNEGMPDIGTACEFELDGGRFQGIINNPDAATQMLTGGYQGRAEVVILATRSQFATRPAQKGGVSITQPEVFKASLWQRKQVEVFGAAHYAITIMAQLPS